MKDDLVTIIIPVYNSEKYIQNTINSIKEQTYTNWEVILVDDYSTDKSIEIIEKNLIKDKIKLIRLDKNSSSAIARNIGIRNAKGRFIAFIDSDDIWEKEKLEKQLKFIKDNNIAFSYTSFEYIYEDKNKKSKYVDVPYELDYKTALKKMKITTSTVMFDLEKISKDLIKMPYILGAEDVATWFKIMKIGYNAYGLDENLMKCTIHKDSISYNKINSCRSRWKVYRNYENFSILKSLYYLVNYAICAIAKRVL